MGSPVRLEGQKTATLFLDTNEDDTGARRVPRQIGGWQRYNPLRDVAILKFSSGIPNHTSPSIFTGELEEEEKVFSYSYPTGGSFTKIEGKYIGMFEDGELGFDMPGVMPGSSGGLITNEQGQAVALLRATDGQMVQAVPIWVIIDAARKAGLSYSEVKPPVMLAPPIDTTDSEDEIESVESTRAPISRGGIDPKPTLPSITAGLYLKEPISPLPPQHADADHHRPKEPIEVISLRRKAQDMVDQMSNLIALETAISSGYGQEDKPYQYEVRIIKNSQIFKSLYDGKERKHLAPPSNGTVFDNQWYELPKLIGTDMDLRIEPRGRILVGETLTKPGILVHVFQFEARMEDKALAFRAETGWGLGVVTHKVYPVSCRGEIWTDDGLNILRISVYLDIPINTGWNRLNSATLYGWLEEPDQKPILVPYSIV
jgi:hypothetical protein